MLINDLANTLISLAADPRTAQYSVLMLGKAGIGKSVVASTAAAAIDYSLTDIRLSQMDPVDLRGIPYKTEHGTTAWATPDFLPTKPRSVLFLDEINAAPPSVAAAAYQLILDRRLGDWVAPPDCLIWAAGNLATDRGVVHTMPAPLTNRFLRFEIETSIDAVRNHFVDINVDPRVIAFLSERPDMLHKFEPGKYAGQQFPTPRSWEKVSNLLAAGLPSRLLGEAIHAAVGTEAGGMFTTFLKLYNTLVSTTEILADPSGAPVPPDQGSRYAVATAIALNMSKFNADKFGIYLNRLPREFAIMAVTMAWRKNPVEISKTALFAQFSDDMSALMQKAG